MNLESELTTESVPGQNGLLILAFLSGVSHLLHIAL
jgi:hypothetical protein